jgi:D-alanyl-D-alanine dipeptidase
VVTPDETATTGILYRFERGDGDSPWKESSPGVSVVVGKTGLASGAGLNGSPVPGLPSKQEGDGKSPAGVFGLTSAFGFDEAPGARLPYARLTEAFECVDDPASRHYNRLVDRTRVPDPDWKSSEKMREIDEYVFGVVVAHNAAPVEAGAGSCIFLHAWSGPGSSTAGCTAMPTETIREIVHWLDEDSHPVLVQLTDAAYADLRRPWQLPPIGSSPER